MIAYDITQEHLGNIYSYTSPSFPGLTGFGKDDDRAFHDFLNKFYIELERMIRLREHMPIPLTIPEIRTREGKAPFIGLNPETSLTLYLHEAMLAVDVSRSGLTKLLAMDKSGADDDVASIIPSLSANKLQPNKLQPNKVRRLLDPKHKSTLQELNDAFRVLGYNLDFVVRPIAGGDPLQLG